MAAVTEAGDRLARFNAWVLAAAAALAGANASVVIATSGLVGRALTGEMELATIPVLTFVLGTAAFAFPAAFSMRRFGRRNGFAGGALLGVAAGIVGAFAIVRGSFPIFCFATFCCGAYQAFVGQYRFAAADTASPAYRPRVIALSLGGGLAAAFVGPQLVVFTQNLWAPYLFAGTLRDNLLLGLRHRPIRPAGYDPAAAKRRSAQIYEAQRSGNIDFDLHADWLDYESAGVADNEGLSTRIIEVLDRLDFDKVVYTLGLRWRLDPEASPEAAARLLEARKALARRLVEDGITHLVETYDVDRFNSNASVAENLLFGTPIGPAFDFEALADNTYVLQVLAKVGLIEDLVEAGKQVAETMVELFADLPADHEFFEQFSFISADDLPEFVAILGRIGGGGPAALGKADRTKLLSLPFRLIPARHRLDVLDEMMQNRLLEARRVFRADLPTEARPQIEFFDAERYNAAAAVQDNILFGKIAYGEADAPIRVPSVLAEVVDALSLRQTVIDVGLDYNVGTGGSRLSFAERQKAGIARAVLKRPDLLILNEATSTLDGQAQSKVIRGLKEEFAGRGIIWVLHRASLARNFDRVLVLSAGKLQEQGAPSELEGNTSLMSLLVAAE